MVREELQRNPAVLPSGIDLRRFDKLWPKVERHMQRDKRVRILNGDHHGQVSKWASIATCITFHF